MMTARELLDSMPECSGKTAIISERDVVLWYTINRDSLRAAMLTAERAEIEEIVHCGMEETLRKRAEKAEALLRETVPIVKASDVYDRDVLGAEIDAHLAESNDTVSSARPLEQTATDKICPDGPKGCESYICRPDADGIWRHHYGKKK